MDDFLHLPWLRFGAETTVILVADNSAQTDEGNYWRAVLSGDDGSRGSLSRFVEGSDVWRSNRTASVLSIRVGRFPKSTDRIRYTNDAEFMTRLFEHFDSPYLWTNFDTGNTYIAGLDPREYLPQMRPWAGQLTTRRGGTVLVW